MGSQTGSHMSSYGETIEGLKRELENYVANLKSATEWPEFERLYRALCTIEELAGTPKTTLEQLFAISSASASGAPQDGGRKSDLALGVQLESEAAAEIEKRIVAAMRTQPTCSAGVSLRCLKHLSLIDRCFETATGMGLSRVFVS